MNASLQNKLPTLQANISNLSIKNALALLADFFPCQVTFSTSFSYEDQIITHEIVNNNLPIKIFTLDTGRLFSETYSVWSRTNEFYNTKIEAYYPDAIALQELVSQRGPNSFYESIENRKECCHIRKVVPLKNALKGNTIWVTGLRAEHSPARQDLQILEWDEGNQLIKYNPLLHWNTAETIQFVHQNNIPYNSLHDKGFVSIGCAPCTRAIKAGEDFRAGRWWWEDANKKECGLHEKQA
ncbi:MAG: phosphoadenylyl-sulfate reductase [Chitinophaga sp.]|jgi:phosphoadenosine phosphosulfate reductase|nr:phosphoadenylyl-sulfate reductase [Chitinophaga sp.]